MPRVLVADDEEFVRYFLKQILESIYFDVVEEVSVGDDLPEKMRESNPDILLLDINMPKLTGIDFLKQYFDEFSETCIIILTSAISIGVTEELAKSGASCVLRKDTPPEEMIKQIQNAWKKFREAKNNV